MANQDSTFSEANIAKILSTFKTTQLPPVDPEPAVDSGAIRDGLEHWYSTGECSTTEAVEYKSAILEMLEHCGDYTILCAQRDGVHPIRKWDKYAEKSNNAQALYVHRKTLVALWRYGDYKWDDFAALVQVQSAPYNSALDGDEKREPTRWYKLHKTTVAALKTAYEPILAELDRAIAGAEK